MTPVLLIWPQETGGTVCIEMLSGCLYINPLRINSLSVETRQRKRLTPRKLQKKGQRMVATTDCMEKSKPTGNKVCRDINNWAKLAKIINEYYYNWGNLMYEIPSWPASLQVSKPLMEKKRRARINQCLDELKTLLESYYSSCVSMTRPQLRVLEKKAIYLHFEGLLVSK